MFIQPGEIPVEFALSVYRIMQNTADASHWDAILEYDITQAMSWIEKILRINNVDHIQAEIAWWRHELEFSKPEKE